MIRTVLFVSVLLIPTACAQSDTADLLRRAANTYSKLDHYVVDIEYTNTNVVTNTQGTPFQPKAPEKIRLARSGQDFSYQRGTRPDEVWTTNGQRELHYISRDRQYIDAPAKPWPEQRGPGNQLSSIEWAFMSRFARLNAIEGSVTGYRTDVPPDSACPFPTVQVTLKLGNPALPAIEQMRIDPRTALICELRRQYTASDRLGQRERIQLMRWTYRQTTGPVEAAALAFTPPQGAHRVKRFGYSYGADNSWNANMMPISSGH